MLQIRVLIVEDSPDDAELMVGELQSGGCCVIFERVQDAPSFRAALEARDWDVVLADYRLPNFSALAALSVLKETGCDVPFIIVSGTIGEEKAVEAMRSGAHDYIMKGNLARLAPAVRREISDAVERRRYQQVDQSLRDTTYALRAIVQASPLAIIAVDNEANVRMWNPAAERVFGWKAEEVLGKPTPIVPEQDMALVEQRRDAGVRGEDVPDIERRRRRKDGSLVDVAISSATLRDGLNNVTGMVALVSDITGRKRTEDELRLRAHLLDAASDSIFLLEPNGGTLYFNEAAHNTLGYSREEMASLDPRDLTSPECLPLAQKRRQELMEKGESAFESASICKDGSIIPIDVHARMIEVEGRSVFLSIHRDITERKKAGEAVSLSLRRLQEVLEGTVYAMSLTVEMRDPYTAGHQKRVARLACAVARELGLGEDEIEGIRIASLLHDIGKIGIPAEILSKPGMINESELRLVRTHPQIGCDIVKAIDFPWPVASIVLQHHEKSDGSGYPSGLKGDTILLSARVVSVADVVEAMCSHRPYRPALPRRQALEEISNNRGAAFDPDVVDACLRVFSKGSFEFD